MDGLDVSLLSISNFLFPIFRSKSNREDSHCLFLLLMPFNISFMIGGQFPAVRPFLHNPSCFMDEMIVIMYTFTFLFDFISFINITIFFLVLRKVRESLPF